MQQMVRKLGLLFGDNLRRSSQSTMILVGAIMVFNTLALQDPVLVNTNRNLTDYGQGQYGPALLA